MDVSPAGVAPEADVPTGYKRTEAGVIPDDWDVVCIGDIADIKNGATPSTGIAANWNGSIPWCTPTDITNTSGKYLTGTARSITQQGLGACGAGLLPAGALLLCSRATIGEIKIASTPVCTNQGFKSLICTDRVHSEFLYYLVLGLKPRLIRQAIGSTFLEVGKQALASMRVQVPPLREQRAVADALSDVDGLLESLATLIAKKRAVKTSSMQQLLTGRTRLPGFSGEWETKQLVELGVFSKGRGIKRSDVREDGYPCIRYGELYTRYSDFVASPVARVPASVALTAQPIENGDLLFAGAGETPDEIGRCAAYVGENTAYAGGDLIILSPFRHASNSLYLGYLLNHPTVSIQKARLAQGDAIVHISSGSLGQVRIELPPVEEQTAIATVLSDMDAEIAALDDRIDKVRSVKHGMMQQLLTGRIRLSARDASLGHVEHAVEEGRRLSPVPDVERLPSEERIHGRPADEQGLES